MALALYRQYRPATFAEVVGQDHVVRPLSAAVDSGQVRHAYLFSGPRGCGKTSSARILARSLNCEQGPTSTPCGVCRSCVALAPDGPGSLDVIEIDAASHGGVDDARDLRERAQYAPVESRYKVYVVDEAHMVTREGFNALLKLVEEPPGHLVFVFATTEPDKVLTTIRSRTFHYAFRLLPPGQLRSLLRSVVEREGVHVDDAALNLVVRAGAGSARDALSVLDQLLSSSGPSGLDEATARALLGATDAALLDAVVDAIAAGDGATVFRTVDDVVESGHDPVRFTADLLERLRDLLVLHAVPEAGERGLLPHPQDQLDTMSRQADLLGHATLSRAADLLHEGLVGMRGTAAPRLLLELTLGRVLVPEADLDGRSLLSRLERLERRFDLAGDAPPAPAAAPVSATAAPAPAAPARSAPAASAPPARDPEPAEPAEPRRAPAAAERPAAPEPARPAAAAEQEPSAAPTTPAPPARVTAEPARVEAAAPTPPAAAPAPAGLDAARVRSVWDDVVAAVAARKKTAAALLHDAQVLEAEQGRLVLSVQHAWHVSRLNDASSQQPVLDALTEVLGGTWRVEAVQGGAGASGRSGVGSGGSGGGQPAAPSRPSSPAAPAPSADRRGGGWPEDEPAAAVPPGAVEHRDAPPDPSPAEAAAPPEDLPSPDDEDAPDSAPGRTGEDAAVALVQTGLGGTVIARD